MAADNVAVGFTRKGAVRVKDAVCEGEMAGITRAKGTKLPTRTQGQKQKIPG